MSGSATGSETSDIDTIVAKVPISGTDCDFAIILWEDHLRFYSSKNRYATSPTHDIPYETWIHIATTREGSTVKFYVNGHLIGKNQLSEVFNVSDNPLIIGNFPNTGFNFSGRMDDLRIYNRSLSQEEVMLLADVDTCNNQRIHHPPSSGNASR